LRGKHHDQEKEQQEQMLRQKGLVQPFVHSAKLSSADLSCTIEVTHDPHQFLGIGGRQSTSLLQDELQLIVRQVAYMQLKESATEGTRQHLAAPILPCTHTKTFHDDSVDVDDGDGTHEGMCQHHSMPWHACKNTAAATLQNAKLHDIATPQMANLSKGRLKVAHYTEALDRVSTAAMHAVTLRMSN